MRKTIFRIIPSRSGIILLAVVQTTNVKRTIAILRMKKLGRIGDFINKAKLIRQSMNGNAFFPSPPISVAANGAFDNDIKILDAAEVTAQTKVMGSAAARNVAKQNVLNDMHLLQGYVQGVADANPAKAIEMVEKSGFDVKTVTPPSKDDFTAKNTKVSGTVKLIVNVKKATGGNRRASFKWQISSDNKTWTELPSTLRGSTEISGLTIAGTYYFRFLVVLKNGESSWSQSVSVVIV